MFLPKNRIFRKFINIINFKSLVSNNKKSLILNNIRNDEHAEVIKELLLRDKYE